MYIPFLLFVMAIILVVIFWELSKINSRLKKVLIPTQDIMIDNKHKEP